MKNPPMSNHLAGFFVSLKSPSLASQLPQELRRTQEM
jgi:hypothetical protein